MIFEDFMMDFEASVMMMTLSPATVPFSLCYVVAIPWKCLPYWNTLVTSMLACLSMRVAMLEL